MYFDPPPPPPVAADWTIDPSCRPPNFGLLVRVELVILVMDGDELKALMIKRDKQPFSGQLSLPGAYMKEELSLNDLAKRIFAALRLGSTIPYLFGQFSHLNRATQHRLVSVGFLAVADIGRLTDLVAGDDAFKLVTLGFEETDRCKRLTIGDEIDVIAYDHATILRDARFHLMDLLDSSKIAFQFLEETFSLTQLRRVHEAISATSLETNRFRKRMLAKKFINGSRIVRCDERIVTGGRPAGLYRLASAPRR